MHDMVPHWGATNNLPAIRAAAHRTYSWRTPAVSQPQPRLPPAPRLILALSRRVNGSTSHAGVAGLPVMPGNILPCNAAAAGPPFFPAGSRVPSHAGVAITTSSLSRWDSDPHIGVPSHAGSANAVDRDRTCTGEIFSNSSRRHSTTPGTREAAHHPATTSWCAQ
jgi:hypothetical protein